MVSNRVIVEWVWQEHPLPTEITSADHASVSAGESFQAEGKGIRPLVWSLSGAPEGITIDPATGKITVSDGISARIILYGAIGAGSRVLQNRITPVPPCQNACVGFGIQ